MDAGPKPRRVEPGAAADAARSGAADHQRGGPFRAGHRSRRPKFGDLGLSSISTPTLLVHGTADSDVHPDQSENALVHLPHSEILRVQDGTHLCVWTDPTSDDIQARIIAHLKS